MLRCESPEAHSWQEHPATCELNGIKFLDTHNHLQQEFSLSLSLAHTQAELCLQTYMTSGNFMNVCIVCIYTDITSVYIHKIYRYTRIYVYTHTSYTPTHLSLVIIAHSFSLFYMLHYFFLMKTKTQIFWSVDLITSCLSSKGLASKGVLTISYELLSSETLQSA